MRSKRYLRAIRERNDSNDMVDFLTEYFPVFIGILLFFAFVSVIAFVVIKNTDNNKELMTKTVRVLEKPVENGNIAWYVMEDSDGNRFRLRTFSANKLLLTVGDVGIVKYRGQTIETFQHIQL